MDITSAVSDYFAAQQNLQQISARIIDLEYHSSLAVLDSAGEVDIYFFPSQWTLKEDCDVEVKVIAEDFCVIRATSFHVNEPEDLDEAQTIFLEYFSHSSQKECTHEV